MINLELAQIFYQMADLLEMQEIEFKPRAYEKVARILETKKKDVKEIYKEEGLEGLKNIPGIGESIAQSIKEYIETGVIEDFEQIKKQAPVDIEELTAIEGVGPKTVKTLYKELGIKNIDGLEKAAKLGKIRDLEGFGEKTEENILEGIEFVRQGQGRVLLGKALPVVKHILEQLKATDEVGRIEAAGSVRRMKETVGDIDILATSSNPEETMEFFVDMDEVVKIWGQGTTKSSIRLAQGLDCDLRIVKDESFGSALQYFTGSKYHNIAVRRIAMEKGYKLNEYGLFKKEELVAGRSEEEVYKAIGLPYFPPEIRTNRGEIEAGIRQSRGEEPGLPNLVGYNQLKGDTHCHTNWSDGIETLEEMAQAGRKMGYEYLIITDHAGFLRVAHALDKKRILKQMKEIDRINQKFSDFRLVKGCEVDILDDGSLALPDEVLSKLEIVCAAVHSNFKMDKKDMTKRVVRAIENPNVNIIAHPTGRVISKRVGFELDLEQVFKAAKSNNVALEINSHLDRLDLNDENIRQAINNGVKLTIGTDAHSSAHFSMVELGIATARRGWAVAKDILNTRSLDSFLSYFQHK